MSTNIEWCDTTWNPVTGCTKISPGCKHCYAERMAKRLKAMGQVKYRHGFRVMCHPHMLNKVPGGRGKVIFVCSMSDLFHPAVPPKFIAQVFAAMGKHPQHKLLLLTKRPDVMLTWYGIAKDIGVGGVDVTTAFPNVGVGVTICNQREADKNIPLLLDCPAAMRFVCAEPMLADLRLPYEYHFGGLDWVICGGESGPGARPMHPDWARGLRDQCQAAGVPFFFKQWGEWWPDDFSVTTPSGAAPRRCWLRADGDTIDWRGPDVRAQMIRVGKKKAGRLLDGRVWDQRPAWFGERAT